HAPLKLFDLATDIGETTNVADRHPEIVARAEEILRREHTPSPYWDFETKRRGPPKTFEEWQAIQRDRQAAR
ncbi:MAG: hypothetical protein D6741_00475, partial [Planctomycetota bacterium]